MSETLLDMAAMIYMTLAIAYIVKEVRYIRRKKKITIISISRLMYSLVFGIIPSIVFFQEDLNTPILRGADYSVGGIIRLYIFMLLSILGYLTLSLGYSVKVKEKHGRQGFHIIEEDRVALFAVRRCGYILLSISIIALYLWSKAYGSITNMNQMASIIRSGRSDISNSFAFMKHFAKVSQYALYTWIAIFLHTRTQRERISAFICVLISGYCTYMYLLASDSRVVILFVVVVVLLLSQSDLLRKRKTNIRRSILKLSVGAFAGLILVFFADALLRYVRYGNWVTDGGGSFMDSVLSEFGFIPASDLNVMSVWARGEMRYKILDDIINSIFAWVPERLIPIKLQPTIWSYNTELMLGAGKWGTRPTDIISGSIYQIGIIGPAIVPFVLGIILKKIEAGVNDLGHTWHQDIFYYGSVPIVINAISHYQLSAISLAIFPYIISYVTYRSLIRRIHKERGKST